MKKTLVESKVIRFYVLLWLFFAIGLFVAYLFGETQTQWRNIGVAGLVLSFVSLLSTLLMLPAIQVEIEARYPSAVPGEKAFLMSLFYFVRGLFLLMGVLVITATLARKDVLASNLVEVGGTIKSIEVYGGESSSLKVTLENNSNEYGTRTFKIPEKKLEQIENALEPVEFVFILIDRKDENAVDDLYVQIYGLRTAEYDYFLLDEYNEEDGANNSLGMIVGSFCAAAGSIYLITGRIKGNPNKVINIDKMVSRA